MGCTIRPVTGPVNRTLANQVPQPQGICIWHPYYFAAIKNWIEHQKPKVHC